MVTTVARIVSFFRTLWLHRSIIHRLEEENFNLRQELLLLKPKSPSPVERVSEDEAKPIRIRRLTYAEEQAQWEWRHNKRAQELQKKLESGFF